MVLKNNTITAKNPTRFYSGLKRTLKESFLVYLNIIYSPLSALHIISTAWRSLLLHDQGFCQEHKWPTWTQTLGSPTAARLDRWTGC